MNIKLKASIKVPGKPLKHFWSNCIGSGRANEGLRTSWMEHLKMAVRECGFKYIRFHGLFHDDMFVYRNIDGMDVFNWQYVDDLFDRLLDIGVRPFVELSFFPSDMVEHSKKVCWWKGNVTPPKKYDKWEKLITVAVTHWVGRYGIGEVRKWYFEVWNEPNLSVFWDGTRTKYFELYRVTVNAIKRIDPLLMVGGPASSNFVPDNRFEGEVEDLQKQMTFRSNDINSAFWRPVWVKEFLDYCQGERLPVDFISTHTYPTDFAFDPNGNFKGQSRSVDSTRADLEYLRKLIDKSPFPEAEIHITEWNSSASDKDCSRDYVPEAVFIVKTNIESSHLVDTLCYWTFTDIFEEIGPGQSMFHGGFGLINLQGIVKPSFHAYRFLNSLGDEEILRKDGCIITRRSSDETISILAYNYPVDQVPSAVPMSVYPDRSIIEDIQKKGETFLISIELSDLKGDTRFIVETLDESHGSAIHYWEDMRCPETPSREQTELLKRVAMETKKEIICADTGGNLNLQREIKPWTVISVRQIK